MSGAACRSRSHRRAPSLSLSISLLACSHPNIVAYHGSFTAEGGFSGSRASSSASAAPSPGMLFIVLEYADGGDLAAGLAPQLPRRVKSCVDADHGARQRARARRRLAARRARAQQARQLRVRSRVRNARGRVGGLAAGQRRHVRPRRKHRGVRVVNFVGHAPAQTDDDICLRAFASAL
jgi:hypothetical protein